MVLPFSLSELNKSSSFWYGLKDLFMLHKLGAKVSLTVKTDDVISDAREVDRTSSTLRAFQGRMGLRRFVVSGLHEWYQQ